MQRKHSTTLQVRVRLGQQPLRHVSVQASPLQVPHGVSRHDT